MKNKVCLVSALSILLISCSKAEQLKNDDLSQNETLIQLAPLESDFFSSVDEPLEQDDLSQNESPVQFASLVSDLFISLKGFGDQTTGGLDGQIYVVKSQEDSLDEGTLRYGVEVLSGPTWIVFDASIFPANSKTSIYLNTPLNLRDNLTIDGRGSQVSIRKIYSWQDALWTEVKPGSFECHSVSQPSYNMGPIFRIRSAKNIIISHVDFLQVIQGVKPSLPGSLDTECFNDVVQIYNSASEQSTRYYSNIWINQSEFRNCGDECIATTSNSSLQRAYITISNNLFSDINKGILIGIDRDFKFMTAVSLYQNRFINVKQRSPRVLNSYAHVFNNVYENWGSYGVGIDNNTRVIIEENVFKAVSLARRPYHFFGTNNTGYWSQRNIYTGVSNPSTYETSRFPSSASRGGPWYYNDHLKINISSRGYDRAINFLSSLSGWKNETNDIRDGVTEDN